MVSFPTLGNLQIQSEANLSATLTNLKELQAKPLLYHRFLARIRKHDGYNLLEAGWKSHVEISTASRIRLAIAENAKCNE